MAEIYQVHLGVLNLGELPSEISEIGDDWETTFKGKRSKIITNLSRVVPDETAYKDVIVNRSNEGYKEFIGTDHPDYNKIMLKRMTKMPARASDYITHRDQAFQEGGDFEAGITENKNAFMNNVKVILRVVGDKDKIWGAVAKLGLLLEGKKALFEEKLNSTFDHLITSTELKKFFVYKSFKATCVAIVNEALSYVVYAMDAGYDDTWIETNIANAYNPLLEKLCVSGIINEELAPYDPSTGAGSIIKIEKDSTTGRWGVLVREETPS